MDRSSIAEIESELRKRRAAEMKCPECGSPLVCLGPIGLGCNRCRSTSRRGNRAGLALVSILAVILLTMPGPMGLQPPSALPHIATSTPNTIQFTTTATATGKATLTYYQNGSAQYASGSTAASIAFALGGATYTNIYSATLTLIVQMANGNVPMVNLTQEEGVYLANTTVPYSFTVSPTVSATNVKVKIPTAFTSAGAVPGIANYSVFLNWSIAVNYLVSSAPAWVLVNGSRENLSYSAIAPTGYVLNQTTVFIPYVANAYPNATTFNLTLNAKNLTTYQLGAGGFTAIIPGLAVTRTLKVSYVITGFQGGNVPVLPIPKLYQLQNGKWQGNASWVNTRQLPYAGQYQVNLTLPSGAVIVPGSLLLTANFKAIRNATYTLAGTTIVILAGTWTTPVGRPVVFQATMQLTGVTPGYSLCTTCIAGPLGITYGEFLAGFEVVLLVAMAFELRATRARKFAGGEFAKIGDAAGDLFWTTLIVFLFILALLLLARLTGG